MHSRRLAVLTLALAAAALAGCGGKGGGNQPAFADLHPVKGVVKRDGRLVTGGQVRFNPEPDKGEFIINAEVGGDGTYKLSTTRATDQTGERKPGAPAGTYLVVFIPALGDQSAGGNTDPVELPKPVTVAAGDNDIPIEVPAVKK